jgi:hypothetical protein
MFFEVVIVVLKIQMRLGNGGSKLTSGGYAAECFMDSLSRGITSQPVLRLHHGKGLLEGAEVPLLMLI